MQLCEESAERGKWREKRNNGSKCPFSRSYLFLAASAIRTRALEEDEAHAKIFSRSHFQWYRVPSSHGGSRGYEPYHCPTDLLKPKNQLTDVPSVHPLAGAVVLRSSSALAHGTERSCGGGGEKKLVIVLLTTAITTVRTTTTTYSLTPEIRAESVKNLLAGSKVESFLLEQACGTDVRARCCCPSRLGLLPALAITQRSGRT